MDIHALPDQLVSAGRVFNTEDQRYDIPPPGNEYGMFTYDRGNKCWVCIPCGNNVAYTHLTCTKHRNRLWEKLRETYANGPPGIPAPTAVLPLSAPPVQTTSASWAAPSVPATTIAALQNLEQTIEAMKRDHADAVSNLRQEVNQLRQHVDGGLQHGMEQLTQLGNQDHQLGREVVALQEQVGIMQRQNDGWNQRNSRWND